MKKFICFVLGLIIGASGAFFLGDSLKDTEIAAEIQEALSESYIGELLEEKKNTDSDNEDDGDKVNDEYERNDGDEPEKEEEIIITPHFSSCAEIGDDIGFPMPSEDMLDPDREGDYVLYDMQDNGKGVLINYYGIGMQKVLADIFVTSDYGKSWEVVERKTSFLSGDLDVIYIGDTIITVNSNGATTDTHISISNDNGKTFDGGTDDENSFAKLIGKDPESRLMAFPIFLSKDTENGKVICAWFRSDVWELESDSLLLISEHDVKSFEITKEFYRNDTAIDEAIENFT